MKGIALLVLLQMLEMAERFCLLLVWLGVVWRLLLLLVLGPKASFEICVRRYE